MIVFSNTTTPRIQYIFNFIGRQTIGEPFRVTSDADFFRQYEGPKINYSREMISPSEFRIQNAELLFEAGVKDQRIQCFERNGYKAFYQTGGDLQFDIFAASFYLLSRFEEYLPHQKDLYGRYDHKNSLAFKENFLQTPLINIWIEDFKKVLRSTFPQLIVHPSSFNFLPTYDIDEAFSYRYKQWWRTIGGLARSMVKGEWSAVNERIRVLLGRQTDPYDSFGWMDELHHRYDLKPIYFFLIASQPGRYDKNILPSKKAMQELIRDQSANDIGIHPSWQSGDNESKLKFEVLKLGHLSGKQILSSRQHFIRFTLPQTYRKLLETGIRSDFSMGYGSINGFRASIANPFYWYDLEKEEETNLLLFPFCFMDANSFYEQKFSPQQAFDELRYYHHIVRSVNGTLITIWHNTFLGTGKLFKGWKDIYEEFIASLCS